MWTWVSNYRPWFDTKRWVDVDPEYKEEYLDHTFNILGGNNPVGKIENNNLMFEVEVPGFKKEQVSVYVEQSILNIKCSKTEKVFRKSILISDEWDIEKTECSLEDGILSITIPKREEGVRRKKIHIKVK